MIGEHKFIVDGVFASLAPYSGKRRALVLKITNLHCWVKSDLVGSEIRLPSKSLDQRDVPPPLFDKSWGSLLFHRPVAESLSFLRLPFREQALGTGGPGRFEEFVWCPLAKWSLGERELIDLSPFVHWIDVTVE